MPGFDIAGVIEHISEDHDGAFQVGDRVYGATFFGRCVFMCYVQTCVCQAHLTFSE